MPSSITAGQLVCLQTLWSRRMRAAGVADQAEARQLRHAFIRELTAGRAAETKELTLADARRVIEVLKGGARIPDGDTAHAAGTHGRRGRQAPGAEVMVGAQQIELLQGYAGLLGWSRERLDGFISRQLRGRQLRTMADANRVLWGLKRMVRQPPFVRRNKSENSGYDL